MVRRVGTKMQGRKDGRVENKLFGKFVRTLGYILLALGLAIAAVTTIIALSGALGSAADNYAQYVEIMETKLQGLASLILFLWTCSSLSWSSFGYSCCW